MYFKNVSGVMNVEIKLQRIIRFIIISIINESSNYYIFLLD